MKTKDTIREEALQAVNNLKHFTVNLSTGLGKTRFGIYYIKQIKGKKRLFKVLIVCPTNSIKESWINELKLTKNDKLLSCIDFVTYRSLLKTKKEYDLIIFDEVHNIKITHVPFLFENRSKYLVGLTGTIPQYGEKKNIIDEYFPVAYEYLLQEAVENNILNNYQVIIHLLPLSYKKDIVVNTKKGTTFKASEYDKYKYAAVKSDLIYLISVMKSFKSKVEYAKNLLSTLKRKSLVFANTQEQADYLTRKSYHSKNKNSLKNLEDFNSGKIIKMSCVEQLSEGVNIKNLKNGIILHSFSGNSPKFRQKLGRLLRLLPDDSCVLHVLCYENTKDSEWLSQNLEYLNPDKIKYYDTKKKQFIPKPLCLTKIENINLKK